MKSGMLKHVISSRLGVATPNLPRIPAYTFRGSDVRIPSRADTGGFAPASEVPMYTGTAMIGVATMHKSNAVPVFSEQEAISISQMRR